MRVSESVALLYFAWTSVLALTLPLGSEVVVRALTANALVFGVYMVLVLLAANDLVDRLRDWMPQALAILAYKQMGWFAMGGRDVGIEYRWIDWDRLFLDTMHGRDAIEAFGFVLPLFLEISYALVYAVAPFSVALLYRKNLRPCVDFFLTMYLLGLLLCYAQFPFWPSEPPRTVYAGQDLPGVHTPVRDFNLWMVGTHGIHTSVFPSAHVSGAAAAAIAMARIMRGRKWIVRGYVLYAALVTVATVYGRYHYGVDAVAGVAIGGFAGLLGLWAFKRVSEPEREIVKCDMESV